MGKIIELAVKEVSVEAVVCGVLQRITLEEGTNPADVLPWLKSLDPDCKVRDDFPRSGKFGGGRETKLARALTIHARITDSGKFVDMVCQNGDDLTVAVSKKSADSFLGDLRALGKLTEKNLGKLETAFESKKEVTIILTDPEQFGVHFWKTDDGKAFMDSLTATPPETGGSH